jgi:hypothetical protein
MAVEVEVESETEGEGEADDVGLVGLIEEEFSSTNDMTCKKSEGKKEARKEGPGGKGTGRESKLTKTFSLKKIGCGTGRLA